MSTSSSLTPYLYRTILKILKNYTLSTSKTSRYNIQLEVFNLMKYLPSVKYNEQDHIYKKEKERKVLRSAKELIKFDNSVEQVDRKIGNEIMMNQLFTKENFNILIGSGSDSTEKIIILPAIKKPLLTDNKDTNIKLKDSEVIKGMNASVKVTENNGNIVIDLDDSENPNSLELFKEIERTLGITDDNDDVIETLQGVLDNKDSYNTKNNINEPQVGIPTYNPPKVDLSLDSNSSGFEDVAKIIDDHRRSYINSILKNHKIIVEPKKEDNVKIWDDDSSSKPIGNFSLETLAFNIKSLFRDKTLTIDERANFLSDAFFVMGWGKRNGLLRPISNTSVVTFGKIKLTTTGYFSKMSQGSYYSYSFKFELEDISPNKDELNKYTILNRQLSWYHPENGVERKNVRGVNLPFDIKDNLYSEAHPLAPAAKTPIARFQFFLKLKNNFTFEHITLQSEIVTVRPEIDIEPENFKRAKLIDVIHEDGDESIRVFGADGIVWKTAKNPNENKPVVASKLDKQINVDKPETDDNPK